MYKQELQKFQSPSPPPSPPKPRTQAQFLVQSKVSAIWFLEVIDNKLSNTVHFSSLEKIIKKKKKKGSAYTLAELESLHAGQVVC